jgi:DNA helicase II / ATP-dependent DNA helicase PcrA
MTTRPSFLHELNADQYEAATHLEGPLLILAGAGAGKTKTITCRILHLISQGISADQILAITFTNKAAKEMKERVLTLLEKEGMSQAKPPFVSTFHALGVHILRNHSEACGLSRHFSIYDRADCLRVIKGALEQMGIDQKEWSPQTILSSISKQKGDGKRVEHSMKEAASYSQERLAKVWYLYEQALEKEGALDFDDLLIKPLVLLEQNTLIREQYQNRFSHVHIDEYQDTNGVQYALSQLLVGPKQNICVVGDADQTIYTWRGANVQNILNFERDYPQTIIIRLEQNYRSTKTILAAANDAIIKNTMRLEKNLYTDNEDGEKISLLEALDENDEANEVVRKTQELLKSGVPAHEIAILYRANFQSRVLEQAFLDAGIQYQMVGTRFFERKEVKDLLSYIRLALNPQCTADLIRIINEPKRGIGKVTLNKVIAGRTDELPAPTRDKVNRFFTNLERIRAALLHEKTSKGITFAMKESGIEKMLKEDKQEGEERLKNIQELVTLALKYDDFPSPEGIEKLLEDAALATDQDTLNKESAVRLMTIHASKGLEFNCVFVTGLEQGLFPQEKLAETRAEQEEERRLFYVALTRARKKVILSRASMRTIFGSRRACLPSEFLGDIDPDHFEEISLDTSSPRKTNYLDIDW